MSALLKFNVQRHFSIQGRQQLLQFSLQPVRGLSLSANHEKAAKDKFKYIYKTEGKKQKTRNSEARKVLSARTYEALKSFDADKRPKELSTEIPANALKKIFFAEFCIFFVFGFFDNFIMMSVGESIDNHLDKFIPHAMLAAAFGNWISDLFGLVSGERVEDFMNKHYPSPPLSHEQMLSKRYHNFKHMGRFVGISIGCLVGALLAYPMLDLEEKKKDDDDEKKQEENTSVKEN